MRPALSIFASCPFDGDIRSSVLHLLQNNGDGFSLREVCEVDCLDFGEFGFDKVEAPGCVASVNDNYPSRALHEGHGCSHLADRTGTPNGNHITFLDPRINDCVPGCAQDIGEVKTLLVWDIVGKFQEVHITI